MPNRIIKETICTSDSIDMLTSFQETFFYRLIVQCDDFGRMDARPKILAARLFPLKDIRESQILETLVAITSAELVDLYMVGEKPFLQMKSWSAHQRIRESKAKYPAPEDGTPVICDSVTQLASIFSNPRQLAATRRNSPPESNPIQSEYESNPNPNPNPTQACAREEAFNSFWSVYPKKVGKADARRAFLKVHEPVEKLISAVETQKRSKQWTKEDGRYVPNPSTWLNQGRWDDELDGGDPFSNLKSLYEEAKDE